MKSADIMNLVTRESYSKYLPWRSYDPETKIYRNKDDSAGYAWECTPQVFAGEKSAQALEGLFRLELPDDTVIQFMLFADDYIEPILDRYRRKKTRKLDIINKMVEHTCEFLEKNKQGMSCMQGIPLRDFRMLVTVNIPNKKVQPKLVASIYTQFKEKLTGALLFPRDFMPEDLIDWMRRFFNDEPSLYNRTYNDDVPINKQVIFSDTIIENHVDYMKTGSKHLRCLTVKSYPEEVHLLQTNELFGGIWGGISDTSQITSPFLFTLTILVQHNLKEKLERKAEFYQKQPAFGSWAKTIATIKTEYREAIHDIGNGIPYVRITPALWVWGSEEQSVAALARVKRMWEEKGYVPQADKIILPALLIVCLPFGTYTETGIQDALERDYTVSSETVVNVLPTQSDFSGAEPSIVFVSRKGQICGIDLFSSRANNSNAFITAGSGAGKSFLVNYLTSNYYGEDALIRIIDIGRSYKKMTHLFGARFLDFDEKSNVCLNPFTHIPVDNRDQAESEWESKEQIPTIGSMIASMCYAKTGIVPAAIAETAGTLTQRAAEWAWKEYGPDADIAAVHRYLNDFPELCDKSIKDQRFPTNMQDIARTLAYNLTDFTPWGPYGKWFNGKATFDISSDEFVVLELENLKAHKALWNIITMQVINAVTQDLYLSDRSRRRLIVFDEAYQFVKDENSLQDVLNEGYRRCRKYGGSFSICTQSVLDLKLFGKVGGVIMANSAFRFFLESNDFDTAASEKLITYPDFVMKLLKTIKSNRPKYSEIFIDSPIGIGPARLAVDPFSYYLFTSDAREIAEIEQMVIDERMTYEKSIIKMVELHRPNEMHVPMVAAA